MQRKTLYSYLIASILLVPQFVHGQVESCECVIAEPKPSRHQAVLGPQWIYLTRKRDGGTKQTGNLYGGYFTYDRLKRYGWYIGAEGSYAAATLKGNTEGGDTLRSKFKDLWIEGRFGYTFRQKSCRKWALTPYIGMGYAQEQNNFTKKSPLPVHFKTHFYYPAIGFRLGANFGDKISAAINFRARYPYDPECRVNHDPENDSLNQKIGERWQYRVELPITYTSECYRPWGISVCPFYEYRPYGEHVNYPFDYFKTTLILWGIGVGIKY